MQGKITECHIRNSRNTRIGGLIRIADDRPQRIEFVESELCGIKLADALGCKVAFDLDQDGMGVRVRPILESA